MTFGQPGFLYLLILLLPLLLLFYWLAGRWVRQRLTRLGDMPLLASLSRTVSTRKIRWKHVLMILAMILVVLALARPQFGSRLELAQQQGVEIVVALDTSLSMTAEDITPNRLERAKMEIIDLMGSLPDAQVSLVLFAGTSFVQLPLTSDFDAAQMFLSTADINTVSLPGTAIGDAIRTGISAFNEKGMSHKAMILLTDGEDHGTDPLGAARIAAKQGITIYPVGFGSPQGEPLPERDGGPGAGFKKDSTGEIVMSKLDEATLLEIAAVTGGEYHRATPDGREIEEISAAIESMDKKQLEERLLVQRVERFQIPALLALIALVGETLLSSRRRVTGNQARGANNVA